MHWNIWDMVTTVDLPWPKNTAHSWVTDQPDEPTDDPLDQTRCSSKNCASIFTRTICKKKQLTVIASPIGKQPCFQHTWVRWNKCWGDRWRMRSLTNALTHTLSQSHRLNDCTCVFCRPQNRTNQVKRCVCGDTRVVMLKQRHSSILCCWPACCQQQKSSSIVWAVQTTTHASSFDAFICREKNYVSPIKY